ncbi:MAG TPA: hypothetical protein VMH31_14395 [Methylomirabilota bacterium]|nr:hypothetical protein [Methylomirabilota bacterium]
MAYEYLDNLELSDEDKNKLKALAAPTPAALLSRIEYSPESRKKLVDYLGSEDKINSIETALRSLGGATRAPLPPFKPALGALEPAENADSSDSQSKVDALVHEIQNLRNAGATAEADEKAAHLRQLLKQS